MYVTLEPCCHQGRTPPCTDAILENGIAHVVIGSQDPNPKAAGGAEVLRRNGITVTEQFLQNECDALNEVFFHYITTGQPYVAMKYAMTADGKTASCTGASKWITGPDARAHVHTLRHRYTGIMAGIGTVLSDDPLLNCRISEYRQEGSCPAAKPRQPVRIICDSHLRIPLDSRICRTAGQYRTIIAHTYGDPQKQAALEAMGITVLKTADAEGRIHLPSLMDALGRMEIDSILLEGGGTLNEAMLQAGLVQKVYAYMAPLLLGGKDAKTPVEGLGFPAPGDGIRLTSPAATPIGDDLLIEFNVPSPHPESRA